MNELSRTPGKFQGELWPYLAICVAIVFVAGLVGVFGFDGINGRLPPMTSGSDQQFHYQTLFQMQTKGLNAYDAQRVAFEDMFYAKGARWGGALVRLPFLFYFLQFFPVNGVTLEGGLYAHSQAISLLSVVVVLSTMFFTYWGAKPLSRGAALAAALLLGFTHTAIYGDLLFQTYGLPLVVLSFGFWVRRRYTWSAVFVAMASLIHESYLVAFGAYAVAALASRSLRPLAIYLGGFAATFAFIAAHISYIGLWDSYLARMAGTKDLPGLAPVLIAQFLTLEVLGDVPGRMSRLLAAGNLFAVFFYLHRSWRNPVERQTSIVLLLLALLPLSQLGSIADAAEYASSGKVRYFTQSFAALPMLYALAWRTVFGSVTVSRRNG